MPCCSTVVKRTENPCSDPTPRRVSQSASPLRENAADGASQTTNFSQIQRLEVRGPSASLGDGPFWVSNFWCPHVTEGRRVLSGVPYTGTDPTEGLRLPPGSPPGGPAYTTSTPRHLSSTNYRGPHVPGVLGHLSPSRRKSMEGTRSSLCPSPSSRPGPAPCPAWQGRQHPTPALEASPPTVV